MLLIEIGPLVTRLPSLPAPPVAIICPQLAAPVNGEVAVSGSNPGDTASYTCISSYSVTPRSSKLRTCQSNGEWTGVDPICECELYIINKSNNTHTNTHTHTHAHITKKQ